MKTDTIYALSSGSVPSGVAVVRISGPETARLLAAMCGRLPDARRAALRTLRRPADAETIDRGIVLWLPGPATYTGEDVAELHVHGSRAVIRAVFDSLTEQGARLAEAGEFSRRAFSNGKLDLTEVEGIADLIAAETEMQRRQAQAQAQGSLGGLAEAWRSRLIDLRAELEARLDFSDEGDVPEPLPVNFWVTLRELRREMADALAGVASGERIREGFRVAILGPPNAGKSSLLNVIAKRDVAIVTEEAGTTRDVLEVPLDLGGYPVLLADTAGLRDAESAAEREGVRRARTTGERADLVLWLQDCTGPGISPPEFAEAPVWHVRTKTDLFGGDRTGGIHISSVTGDGLSELVARIQDAAAESLGGGSALVTRQRQRIAVAEAADALDCVEGAPDEVAADLLRAAGEAIGRLTGRIDVEEVLDRLFSEFCIGK